jgi:hypothetical protein
MMNQQERDLQLAKLKMIQMINTYLSVGLLAMIAGGTYLIGWGIAQVIAALF